LPAESIGHRIITPASSVAAARAMLLLLLAVLAGGCDGGMLPDRVDVNGHWTINYGQGPSDFHLDLRENADGTISGTWSYPQQFAYHSARGYREGLEVRITADSPNIFPTAIRATFVGRDRMEGLFLFGGGETVVTLKRGRGWK
jgi:hypothetical protein